MWDILLTVIAILALICIWIIIYDSNRFVVTHFELEDERIQKACKAAVIADLHNKQYGRDNELLLRAIEEQKPDMIFIAGDIPTARPGASLTAAIRFVGQLAEKYPVYYGNGNHEQRMKLYPETYGDMAEIYAEGLAKAGVLPLVNAHVKLEEYGIAVYGAEIDRTYYKRFRVYPMDASYMESILGKVDKSYFTVLLAHNPDYFEQYAKWGADFVLSGHVHGGIVRIPFVKKGVAAPNISLFPKYDGGIFREGTSTMLLSRGLGMHTIPIRLFNPGELVIVEMQPKQK